MHLNIAEQTTIQVRLTKTEGFLELSITDNGEGFDLARRLKRGSLTEGMGLIGMKERAELSNGVFEIGSEIGQGMSIRVIWPDSH